MASRAEQASPDRWVESARAATGAGEAFVTVREATDWSATLGEPEGSEWLQLQIAAGKQAQILCRHAPAPIWVRSGQVIALPWQESTLEGLPLRKARFPIELGDYGVAVNRGYLEQSSQSEEQLATAVRRWGDTGCDAYQLRDCLLRTGQRLASQSLAQPGVERGQLAVLALHVRPIVTATVWSGPPLDSAQDRAVLDTLLAEPGWRILCGDTTAQIAARLLGKPLRVEQAGEGRDEAPPLAHLEGVDLVTEGVVTLRQALRWLRGAETARDLPRHIDAATRLAGMLLAADRIHFLAGQAQNRAYATAGSGQPPPRLGLLKELFTLLQAKEKWVTVTWV